MISDIILPCELMVNQNDEVNFFVKINLVQRHIHISYFQLTDILRFLRTFQRLGINQKYSYLEDVYMNTFPLWVGKLHSPSF